ncbi:hypothetical protein H1R20_g8504, partial [Candolleomyces eurysporus]
MAVTTVPIVNFLDYLSQNPDPYNDCDVISVTHAKNLDSRVKHEYLHLIIRHRITNRWRRLIAERQNTQDQVIIGFWPWVDQGGSASSSGPIALAAIKFKKEMETVLEGAATADSAEKEDKNAESKDTPEAHKATGNTANSDVSIFEENELSDESESTKYAMEQVSVISNLDLDEPEIRRVTKERKEEISVFSTLVLANPEKEANLAFFESCLSSSKEAEVGQDAHPDPFVGKLVARVVDIGSVEAPSKEEEARYEEAIRAFAGAVLRQVRQDGIVF